MRVRRGDGFLRNDGNMKVLPPMNTDQAGVAAFYSNTNPHIKYDVLCDKNNIFKIFFREKRDIFLKRYLIKLR